MEGRPLDETTLIARACKGDVSAYEELVRLYQEVAFRTAYLVLKDAGEAEDVTQEAFLKAFYALGRFNLERPFRPWLLRIVTNESLNTLKAARRRGTLAQRYLQASESEDAAPSPEVAALGIEQRRLLAHALDTLKEEQRLVISLRFFLELSEQEMAEVLKCPRGTVKSRLTVPTTTPMPLAAPHSPEATPAQTPTPVPTPTPIPAPYLAGSTTLPEARRRIDFTIRLPTYPEKIGEPEEVYVQELYSPSDVQVILMFRARPGLALQPPDGGDTLFTLYQFRTQGIYMKDVYSGTKLAELTVSGAKAFWLQGNSHVLKYRDASGRERVKMERVVKGNTLAWEAGEITYRLGTSLPKKEALKIAESLR